MSDPQFRRVHRLTPLLRFWTLILAALAVTVVNLNAATVSRAWEWLGTGQIWPLLAAAGMFVLVCGLVWLLSQWWWQATGYRLDGEEIAFRQGVLNKALRTARFDRIQAVDVVESVIARIFGLAAVRVETAGGSDSVIEIAFLGKEEAEALRAELVGRTAVSPGPEVQRAGEVIVPEIPIRRSLAGAALQSSALTGVVSVLVIVFSPLGWATLIPVVLGFLPVIWNQIDRAWRFTALLDADVLHISYGLADRRRQSLPLDRIHGVTLGQPWLWRRFGWWYVAVSVAGYGATPGRNAATTRILPVGSRDEAARLLQLVSPVPDPQSHPPTYTSPPRARWVSPVDLRQQSVTVLPHAVITRQGRFTRRFHAISPAHIQELSLVRGPVQQLLGLCTVRLDLVPGPVRMAGEDLSPADGQALLEVLRRRRLPAR